MAARLLGDLPRLFYFLVVANVQVLHHILAMGRLPIEPPFPRVKRFRWVTKSRFTRTYTQQSAGNRRSTLDNDGRVCDWVSCLRFVKNGSCRRLFGRLESLIR
jgi:hypothetical protein